MTEPAPGLYIHWPFCASKCPYCDFNSHVRRGIDEDAWQRALVAEIARAGTHCTLNAPLGSVFFGGGTPSLMPPRITAACLDAAERAFGFAPGIEITLEANPTSTEVRNFAGYRAAGVNRLSLGVQSLRDEALRALGRTYSVTEALRAMETARRLFARISFDFIYARTDHVAAPDAWATELREALRYADDHLSLYQLTLESGTRFAELYARGRLHIPTDDTAADLYALTEAITAEFGFCAYETSNYARPGGESRHNLVYWRYGLYAGVGPGACSRVLIDGRRHAGECLRAPEAWLEAALHGESTGTHTPLSDDEQAREFLLMGLRLREGVSMSRFRALFGCDIPLPEETMPFLSRDGDRLRLTAAGIPVGDAVIRALVRELPAFTLYSSPFII